MPVKILVADFKPRKKKTCLEMGVAGEADARLAFGRSVRRLVHLFVVVNHRALPSSPMVGRVSGAVQSRASARSQALDATCVSRKRHQVHGDASFCAERKIPTNIAGIPHIVTRGFREQIPRRPNRPLQTRHINRIQSLNPSLFF